MTNDSRSALRRIAWGLVWCTIDIHILIIDILPDVIGYLFVLSGLVKLNRQYGGCRQAIWLAGILACLALPQLVIKPSFELFSFREVSFGLHMYIHLVTGLHVLLVFFLFRTIFAIARVHKQRSLLDTLAFRRNFYMILGVIQLVFYPFLLNVEDSWVMLLLIVSFFMLLLELLLIRIPFRLSRMRSDT
jgi:hypothetical protein